MLVNSQSPKTFFANARLVLELGQGQHQAAVEDVRAVRRGRERGRGPGWCCRCRRCAGSCRGRRRWPMPVLAIDLDQV